MFNKILIILLLLTGLYADNGWSEPVLLSPPEQFTGIDPIIVSDKFNKLYVFWTTWSYNVHYRVSLNDGQSWSGIDSSTTNPSDRPISPKVVFDSQNNLHLLYPSINGKYYYQKMINGQWSTPLPINNAVDTGDKVTIDKDDNIYVFWLRQGNVKIYYQILYADGSISSEKSFANKKQHAISYDGAQTIYLASCSELTFNNPNNRAYCLSYNIPSDSVVEVTDISNNLRPSMGVAITSNHNSRNKIYAALNVYPASDTASTWVTNQNNSSWQIPQKLKTGTLNRHQQLLLDRNDNQHLFDLSLHYDTLYHFYQTATGWQEENVVYDQPGESYWIGSYQALIFGNQLYLIYDYCLTGQSYRVYFTKKTIPVSMEDNGQLTMDNLQLVNYPNPFNNSTKINFNLTSISEIKLEVFNAKGELVQSVFKGQLKSGKHDFSFNATSLNSGVYYCRLTTATEIKTTKIMLLK